MTNTNATSTKINFDADLAKWLLSEVLPFVADRPLRAYHVAKLASEMRNGHFIPEATTIMVADMDGVKYRMNGQHTATAVVQMSEEVEGFALKGVNLLTFSVENEAQLRALYARIDRGNARTNNDVSLSILFGTESFQGVSKLVLKLLPVGLALMKFEESTRYQFYSGEPAANDVQGEYLETSKAICDFIGRLNYRPDHHGHMFRGSVVAALYATFAVDQEDAEKFWQAVATGVGFESESEPAARLRQTLKSINISGGANLRGYKSVLNNEDVYRACLHAWNRYREGKNFHSPLRPTILKSRPVVK